MPRVKRTAVSRLFDDWRLGRAAAFRLETTDDPVFGRRLVLSGRSPGGWIVLSYRNDLARPPLRPALRVLRTDGTIQDFILPGGGQAHWLGLLPRDTAEVRIAAGPGFVLDRVGRRHGFDLLGECFFRRPLHWGGALYAYARRDLRRYRDILRNACAVTTLDRFAEFSRLRRDAIAPAPAAVEICVLIPARPNQKLEVARTLAGLRDQTYPHWRVRIVWTMPEVPPGDERITHVPWRADLTVPGLIGAADAVCLLEPGDVLTPDALACLAAGLGPADLVYGDETGRDGLPRLKPDWSPDFALAGGYVGRPQLAARGRLPVGALGPHGGFAFRFDLAVASAPGPVRHVPRLLARRGGRVLDPEVRQRLLERHLAERGSRARTALRGKTLDLQWPLPEPAPLVSIVIPSRDRLDLIGPVCRGVLTETDYPAIELVIVDNGSVDPAVLAHYETLRADPRVRILSDPRPFNFSALVNHGVAASTGPVVLLLNNDIEVLEPGWLEAMVRQAVRPDVGAVGAKLLYGDGTLQHAGVVVGLGGRAGHLLRRRPADAPGHLGQLRVAHEVSAVTAACIAVERRKYDAIGGFDAEAFPIDFNDVDFCLRLGAAGYKTMWTPGATLSHLESVSRGPAVGPARERFEREAARFSERWLDVIRHDPHFHPVLSLTSFGEDLE